LSRKYRASNPKPSDPGELVPLNPLLFGSSPFGDAERARLHAWLEEAGWPRSHMDIAELEGYLVALVAWPVGISAGAWLPPVWGEQGWKVANKIAAPAQYEAFVALVYGFLHDLERQLMRPSSRFECSILRRHPGKEQAAVLHEWTRGFMRAVSMGFHGLKGRGSDARAAVVTIANWATPSVHAQPHAAAVEEVVSATLSLMAQRTSRGPLGSLGPAGPPKPKAARAPPPSLLVDPVVLALPD
jgi:yecA family protein